MRNLLFQNLKSTDGANINDEIFIKNWQFKLLKIIQTF